MRHYSIAANQWNRADRCAPSIAHNNYMQALQILCAAWRLQRLVFNALSFFLPDGFSTSRVDFSLDTVRCNFVHLEFAIAYYRKLREMDVL